MRPRFSIRDLLLFTTTVALHLSVYSLAAEYVQLWFLPSWIWFVFAAVFFSSTLITLQLHKRYRFDLPSAGCVHCVVSAVWAGAVFVGYCIVRYLMSLTQVPSFTEVLLFLSLLLPNFVVISLLAILFALPSTVIYIVMAAVCHFTDRNDRHQASDVSDLEA